MVRVNRGDSACNFTLDWRFTERFCVLPVVAGSELRVFAYGASVNWRAVFGQENQGSILVVS
jgi:hypothetical protein